MFLRQETSLQIWLLWEQKAARCAFSLSRSWAPCLPSKTGQGLPVHTHTLQNSLSSSSLQWAPLWVCHFGRARNRPPWEKREKEGGVENVPPFPQTTSDFAKCNFIHFKRNISSPVCELLQTGSSEFEEWHGVRVVVCLFFKLCLHC